MCDMMITEYDKLRESLQYVKSLVGIVPKIGIICGSGLGNIVDMLENPKSIPYAKIPHFPQSTVVGHSGELVFGFTTQRTATQLLQHQVQHQTTNNTTVPATNGHTNGNSNGISSNSNQQIPIVCMRGRVHLYEGYDVIECIRPVRLMAMLGIEILCVTNAAGSVNMNYTPGDFMIIKDHISFPSLAGENPLRGPNDSRFGHRFVTMSNAYDQELINEFEDAALQVGLNQCVRKGVYAMVVGPTYETIAEARALKLLGADTIGMSTVHEIIAAHQMGVRCIGISLITNNILIEYNSMEDIVEHENVVDMATKKSQEFIKLILAFIKSQSILTP